MKIRWIVRCNWSQRTLPWEGYIHAAVPQYQSLWNACRPAVARPLLFRTREEAEAAGRAFDNYFGRGYIVKARLVP